VSKWAGSPLAPLLQLRGVDDLLSVRELKSRILMMLKARNMTAKDLCQRMDTDRDQILDIAEIVGFLSSAEMQQGGKIPTPEEMARLQGPLLVVADRRMDGQISVEEFVEFLSET
jgi:hypothetical protein